MRLASDWIGADPFRRERPLDIVFCADAATLLATERAHGYSAVYGHRDSSDGARTFAPRGGCYEKLDLIALLAAPQQDRRRLLAHELSHHALESTMETTPDALNEGFAEFVSYWSCHAPDAPPHAAGFLSSGYAARLAADLDSGKFPSLAEFIALDYWQFRDERLDFHPFAWSWSLIHLLATATEPPLKDGFPRVVASLRRGEGLLAALGGLMPLDELDRRWRAHARAMVDAVPLEPLWMDFLVLDRRVVAECDATGIALALAARGGAWDGATAIEAAFPPFPWRSIHAGFAVDGESRERFRLIGLCGDPPEVLFHRFEGDRFLATQTVALPKDFDPSAAPLRLERGADGHARLWQDVRLLADFALDAGSSGRLGLYVEKRPVDDGSFVDAVFTFDDVTVER